MNVELADDDAGVLNPCWESTFTPFIDVEYGVDHGFHDSVNPRRPRISPAS
jgi:hypothetical protein